MRFKNFEEFLSAQDPKNRFCIEFIQLEACKAMFSALQKLRWPERLPLGEVCAASGFAPRALSKKLCWMGYRRTRNPARLDGRWRVKKGWDAVYELHASPCGSVCPTNQKIY